MNNANAPLITFIIIASIWFTSIAAYITHIAWSVKLLIAGGAITTHIVLAALGLFPLIGIIHGVMLWFGVGAGWPQ